MARYTIRLFGITVFAIALIWFVGDGEAFQAAENPEPVLWADTVHLNLEGNTERPPAETKRDTFLKDVKKLSQTAFHVRNNYMEEVDTHEIIKAGIRGMLSDLDRFSVLMEKASYDALMESTHGKYSGLGMQIDASDDHIRIISPIEGTPAARKGLRAGDLIITINGETTKGMSSSDASKIMRGPAGTSVVLGIRRNGSKDLLDFEVERAVIELKSVNYYGIVPGTDIGYVRLSRFAEETSRELREAINALNDQNISGLIFDLRNNGGGLLDQAKETGELFLKSGSEIVYTKGKFDETERHYESERPPIFPDKPLIVLVNEGTASASEIVAGAIQDWDRGLILGATTYGKGLVQQIFPISSDGSLALKLTTAKYYVPSGRCIQREDRQGKKGSTHAGVAGVDDEEADSLTVTERAIFYTNGGREVYGGGGIVPDIEVESDVWEPIEINLVRQSMFFDYAIEYVGEHPDVKPTLEITDEILESFRSYIAEKEFDYKTSLQYAFEQLEETITDEDKVEMFKQDMEDLEGLIEKEKDADFNRSTKFISRQIKREIVAAVAGERGTYEEIVLKIDEKVQQAVQLLKSSTEYSKHLTEGKTKKELN